MFFGYGYGVCKLKSELKILVLDKEALFFIMAAYYFYNMVMG
jgi:hypothetical protein